MKLMSSFCFVTLRMSEITLRARVAGEGLSTSLSASSSTEDGGSSSQDRVASSRNDTRKSCGPTLFCSRHN